MAPTLQGILTGLPKPRPWEVSQDFPRCVGVIVPQPDPRTVIPALEEVGQRLYEAQARYMEETQQRLAKTYNLHNDPTCTEPRVVELRRLHKAMDRAVLEAYGDGFRDIEVPPYVTPTTDAERARLEAFEDEVIDQLFQLNARRAEEERKGAVFVKPGEPAKRAGKKRKAAEEQGELL